MEMFHLHDCILKSCSVYLTVKAITHGGSISILTYESYHYALSHDMTHAA